MRIARLEFQPKNSMRMPNRVTQYHVAMLTLFRDPINATPPLIPKPAPGPDYAGLVDILIDLQPPDNAGEIVINADEANRIAAPAGPLTRVSGAAQRYPQNS
jgi:hypothetical protein